MRKGRKLLFRTWICCALPMLAALSCSAVDTNGVATVGAASPVSNFVPLRDPFTGAPPRQENNRPTLRGLRAIELKEAIKRRRANEGDFWYPPGVERLCEGCEELRLKRRVKG